MGWIRKRLAERSTKNGLAILAAVLGIQFSPEQVDVIIAAVLAVYAAYESVREEA